MDAIIEPVRALHGTVTVGADKAICHRAVLAAALSDGRTEIRPWPAADDCQRTLEVVQQLGAKITRSPSVVSIEGWGRQGIQVASPELCCGESGTTLRLTTGVLAGHALTARLSAGPLLSRRPMQRLAVPLRQMGARLEGAPGPGEELCPPLVIHGRRPLRAIHYAMPVPSAQVKSAILLAGVFADGPTTVIESVPTRDHTERMLRHCGITVTCRPGAVTVQPGRVRAPRALVLPGDFSSAAFFLVAACCVPGSSVRIESVSLNPSRTGLLRVLQRMGARLNIQTVHNDWEPCGVLEAHATSLSGVTVSADEVPGVIDELPVLMVAAACAQGMSRFESVGELRVKETDRIASMTAGLQQLGVRLRVLGTDVVEVEGGSLTGNVVESAGDHRTAMSLAVAALVARGSTRVRGAECVAKSFPEFFDSLRSLAGSTTVKIVDNVEGPC